MIHRGLLGGVTLLTKSLLAKKILLTRKADGCFLKIADFYIKTFDSKAFPVSSTKVNKSQPKLLISKGLIEMESGMTGVKHDELSIVGKRHHKNVLQLGLAADN